MLLQSNDGPQRCSSERLSVGLCQCCSQLSVNWWQYVFRVQRVLWYNLRAKLWLRIIGLQTWCTCTHHNAYDAIIQTKCDFIDRTSVWMSVLLSTCNDKREGERKNMNIKLSIDSQLAEQLLCKYSVAPLRVFRYRNRNEKTVRVNGNSRIMDSLLPHLESNAIWILQLEYDFDSLNANAGFVEFILDVTAVAAVICYA